METPRGPRFGEIAVAMGFITKDQLEEALARQQGRRRGTLLGLILVEMGALTEADVLRVLQNATFAQTERPDGHDDTLPDIHESTTLDWEPGGQ